jgi:hypothetical protein
MVVLEAAAIGAAGYGLYKGGEAGIRKGKDIRKEYTRESVRAAQRSELGQKTRARNERISQIMNMRRGGGRGLSAAAAASFAESSSPSATTAGDSDGGAAAAATDEPNASSTMSVDERHKAVMAKLRASRREESRKSINKGSVSGVGRFNPFKRK